jgi:hypothetical protein
MTTPYRSERATEPVTTIRLAEPRPILETLGHVVLVTGSIAGAWGIAVSDAGGWRFAAAAALALAAVAMIATGVRRRAWVVVHPRAERIRVARSGAFDFGSSLLKLSRGVSVEYVSLQGKLWLALVSADGRIARVLPGTRKLIESGARDQIEEAIERHFTPD